MGTKYIVTWALGHLVTLAGPEDYDVKYKSWKMEDLPMLPKDLKLVVIKETSKQYKMDLRTLNREEIMKIYFGLRSQEQMLLKNYLTSFIWREEVKTYFQPQKEYS